MNSHWAYSLFLFNILYLAIAQPSVTELSLESHLLSLQSDLSKAELWSMSKVQALAITAARLSSKSGLIPVFSSLTALKMASSSAKRPKPLIPVLQTTYGPKSSWTDTLQTVSSHRTACSTTSQIRPRSCRIYFGELQCRTIYCTAGSQNFQQLRNSEDYDRG